MTSIGIAFAVISVAAVAAGAVAYGVNTLLFDE